MVRLTSTGYYHRQRSQNQTSSSVAGNSYTVEVIHCRTYNASRNTLKNVFLNARGQPLTRFGIRYILQTRIAAAVEHCPSLSKKKVGPHTFRHTTAMHLLQSGVDLTVIKNWLGHVNLDTTHAYVEIDLDMKRKALSSYAPVCK